MELYSKKALTFQDQLNQLISRGLIVEDKQKALHYLSHINYYRLSAYIYPFLKNKSDHIFKDGTQFNTILDIYIFDRELRLLLLNAIERLEISFRTTIIYKLSHKYNPFWVQDESIFKNKYSYQNNYQRLLDEVKRSDEEFIKHFYKKYSNEIPPAWISLETVSFGLLSLFFKNLISNRDQKEVAKFYGLNHKVFISWLHSLVYIRNVCAHHSRLWNRELGIQPIIPKNTNNVWLSNSESIRNDRIFFMIAVVVYFLRIINPSSQFVYKLNKLLSNYPSVDLAPMGFPIDWENEILFTEPFI